MRAGLAGDSALRIVNVRHNYFRPDDTGGEMNRRQPDAAGANNDKVVILAQVRELLKGTVGG